jgi:hypothetical protein
MTLQFFYFPPISYLSLVPHLAASAAQSIPFQKEEEPEEEKEKRLGLFTIYL